MTDSGIRTVFFDLGATLVDPQISPQGELTGFTVLQETVADDLRAPAAKCCRSVSAATRSATSSSGTRNFEYPACPRLNSAPRRSGATSQYSDSPSKSALGIPPARWAARS